MISKKTNIQIFILILVFVFALKYFQSTPYETIFFKAQAGFLVIVLFFLVAYVVNALLSTNQIGKVELYYLLLIAIIPIYGAYRAAIEFKQPYIYGILSERGWLLLGVGIWFYYILVTKKIAFSTIESAFIFMAWSSLVVFAFFILTFDFNHLEYYKETSRLVKETDYRGLRFKFQTYFIMFGAIYYFIKYLFNKKTIDFLFFLVFVGYILFVVQGRIYIIVLVVTLLCYYLFNYSMNRILLNTVKVSVILFLAVIVLQVYAPDYIGRMGYMYEQMFQVISGELSKDSSANARIYASKMVLGYFDAEPLSFWFGTGSVSHHWNEGYESIFGHFYSGDIGLLGGLFVYGIVGCIFIFAIPFIISLKIFKEINEKKDVFVVALKYLLFVALIRSIQGGYLFFPIEYIIPLFILIAYIKMHKVSYDD